MKITLISTSPDVQCYGIRTISACLKKDGHDVDLIFLQKSGNLEKELIKFKEKKINYYIKPYADKTMDDLVELTKESDLVGITLMSNNWDDATQITKKIKENYNIPVA